MSFNLTPITNITYQNPGKFGQALSSSAGTCPNPVPTNGIFTVDLWVKTGSGAFPQIAAGAENCFWIGTNYGKPIATYGAGSASATLTAESYIFDNAWHHLRLVVSGDGGKLFVDGVMIASSTKTASAAGCVYTENLGIGAHGIAAYNFNGQVDEVAIFSTALSTTDFTPPTAPYEDYTAGLVALWHLDGNLNDSLSPPPSNVKPDATITGVVKRGQKVIVSFTSNEPATSGTASLPAASTPNGATTVAGVLNIVGGMGGTAEFVGNPGNYAAPIIILTNQAGSGICTGGSPVTVDVPPMPVITISSQTNTASSITVSGVISGYPTNATLAVAGPTNKQVNLSVAEDGSFTATVSGLATGTNTPTISASNYSGTATKTGAVMSLYPDGQQPPGLPAITVMPFAAPPFDAPTITNGGNITSITLENETGLAAMNQPFTIGHTFKQGQLKMSDSLVGKVSGQADIALQFDPKTTWPDGSVSHGLISGIVPSIGANALVQIALTRSTSARNNTPTAPSVVATAGINAMATIIVGGVTYIADANSVLTAGTGVKAWRAGPVCTEYTFEAPFKTSSDVTHPDLVAQFAIKYFPSSGKACVDVSVENCNFRWSGSDTLPVSIPEITYDVNLSAGGASVYSKAGLAHWPACIWKKTFWFGPASVVHVKFDVGYLLDTKMIPNYDRQVSVAESTLATYNTSDMNDGPMQSGSYIPYMPTSGGHEEIGIHPRWTVDWLLSQDKRAKKFALANASSPAGAWRIHLRNRTDGPTKGYPVDVVHFPRITFNANIGDGMNYATGKNEHVVLGDSTATTSVDVSHQPSFSTVAYMLTGDYAYLEDLIFWSSYNSSSGNPNYREFTSGIFKSEQPRGQAWALRTAAYCAALVPDAHPLKAVHLHILKKNFEWYNAQYTDNPNANTLGAVVNGEIFQSYGEGLMAPWMDDFITQSVGVAADLGFAEAGRFLAWKSKFALGRMLGPGFCWVGAAPYNMRLKDSNSLPLYTTFDEVYQKTYASSPAVLAAGCGSQEMATAFGRTLPKDMGNDPTIAYGYPAILQSALAYAVDAGVPDADLAYDVIQTRALKPDYSSTGSQFNVVPRSYVSAPVDSAAPVMQGTLFSSNVTQTGYTLTWQAATDNTAVTGYEFSTNGTTYTDIGNTLSYVRSGLTASTLYTNYVRAYDAAGNKSAPLTLNVTTATAYVASVLLKLRTAGTPATNLSGLKWAWFDQVDPSLFVAPTDKGSVETTDENGNILISLPNSTKTSGQIGWLIVTNSDGNPNTLHKAFTGPMAVV